MSGRILWKLILVALVALWAGSNLIPLQDTPFNTYITTRATANEDAYAAFLKRAHERVDAGESHTLYRAMLELANDERLDLHGQFFPDINLLYTKNLKKRNELMMQVLLRHSQGKIRLGLDLSGGIAFTLQIGEQALEGMSAVQRESQVEQVVAIMRDRVNSLGVAEPVIRPKGENAVEIQLPGVSTRQDPEAINSLKKPARLEFRMVHRSRIPPPDAEPGSTELLDNKMYEVLVQEIENDEGEMIEMPLYVQRIPLATGKILEEARPTLNEIGGYEISMQFTDEGGDIFAQLTKKIADGNRPGEPAGRMAIVLDGKLYSAPTVREELRGGAARITGQFSRLEAIELASVLNNPLEVPLEITEMYEVGPTLAKDARTSSIEAGYLGAGLVIAFMLVFYRLAGCVSVLTVLVNLFLVIGVLASLGATITLPGVAALVLTIGMAVDANILIFERIREELRSGKRTETAIESGFDKAFSTIIDANVTTLITACILIFLGTGPVKGFGVTLAIGIASTVFTALIFTRALLEMFVAMGVTRVLNPNRNPTQIAFQHYRKPAFLVSWLIVICGIVALYQVGDKAYGIDFTGGEELTMAYEQTLDVGAIQQVAQEHELGEVVPTYQTMIGEEGMDVLRVQTENDKSEAVSKALHEAFPEAGLETLGTTVIGASVSSAITMNAFISVGVALAGILLYIALRFEFGYGIGAVVATVHDVLMTIGLFIIFGQFVGLGSGQFTAPMVAAILMIVGYSINDTIVVFDRIREELELNPGMNLYNVVNFAINRTLSRTILTSVTTLLAAVSLFIFGAGVIADYALVFVIGILTGTFSSIFIASPVFYWWHKGDRRHVEERELMPKYEWETGAK